MLIHVDEHQAAEILDAMLPDVRSVADCRRIAGLVNVLSKSAWVAAGGDMGLVRQILRELYKTCEHRGESWSDWIGRVEQ